MSELSLQQIDFLIDTLRKEKCLEIFDLSNREKLSSIFGEISIGQKKLIHYLIIKNYTDKLIDVMDQFGIERK